MIDPRRRRWLVSASCVLILAGCTNTDLPAGNSNQNGDAGELSDNANDNGTDGMPVVGNENENDNPAAQDAPTCAEYCDLIQSECGDTSEFTTQYESTEVCLAYCETWAALPAGTRGVTAGNSIGCRISQVEVAAAADGSIARLEACEAAGPGGGNVCGSWCENYCFLSQQNCSGHPLHPDSEEACLELCAGINDQGRPGASSGNSVQCRITHAGAAGNPAEITGDENPPPPLDEEGNAVTSHREWYCPPAAPESQQVDGSTGPCN